MKLISLLSAVSTIAFANSNSGSKLYVCADPQQSNLDLEDYESLTWVEVKAIGNHGETGSNTNVLTYDTWDTDVIQKSKGITDAGSPEIELARIANDPGQNILRAAALTRLNYAFKMLRNDEETIGGSPSVFYNRGLVMGPRRPNGRNEDFDLEIFTLGLNQREVVQNAASAGVAPTNTVVPAITGVEEVGEILTSSTGTFTGDAVITYAYRWYAGGVPIEGATGSTFTLTTAQIGKIITVRVVASNASGNAAATSAPTDVVVA